MKRMRTDQFIKKAREVHGDMYNYSKVEYINNFTKVCIICPIHGEFYQSPNSHLRGNGCSKCHHKILSQNNTLTTEEFIEKARKIHGDKYDYSKVQYKKSKEKVCIICPEHGEFWQSPSSHLQGQGCPKCYSKRRGRTLKITEEDFKQKYFDILKKYDLSNFRYIDSKHKIKLICHEKDETGIEHGEFEIKTSHLLSGSGCPKCAKLFRYDNGSIIQKFKYIHGDMYDYSKVEYVNSRTKVCIVCPKHGEFWQTPRQHLKGDGCPCCRYIKSANSNKKTNEEFIEKAKEIHGDKYDYSKIDYKGIYKPVCIICPEHGEFWQIANTHLQGCGCPKCNQSHLEREVMLLLEEHNIKYEYQKRFKWLGRQSLDFYLPDYNIAIECQGKQHFEPVNFGSKKYTGEELLQQVKKRDSIKYKKCLANDVQIIYYKKEDDAKDKLLNNLKNNSYVTHRN